MIPTREDIDVTGDLAGTKVRMQISSRATQHLMSILTNLYGDPMEAVIREYSTNAADSHIEAGQTRPIEISTPTDLNRVFVVQDFGVGMSFEDIEQIYSQYGESTKRDTNTQTGMLGLGSKSALTFTNQFYVRSVKDGWLISIIVHRDGEGAVMEVVDRKTTDESNGVKVTIPVSGSIYAFNDKVKEFFRFWKPGTVLVDGKEPEFPEGTKWLSEDMALLPLADVNYQKDYVVMGNVAYKETNNLVRQYKYNHRYAVVCYVGIGEVDFTPSRESLHYTDRTNKRLTDLRSEYIRLLDGLIDKEIDAAATPTEAFKVFMGWRKLITTLTAKSWRGQPLTDAWQVNAYEFSPHAYGYKTMRIDQVGLGALTAENARVIVDWTGNRPAGVQQAKIKKFFENDISEIREFFLFDKLPGSPWTDDIETYSWNDISKIKIPRAPKPTTPVDKEYDYFKNSSAKAVRAMKESDLKKVTDDIVFFSSTEFRRDPSWMQWTFYAFPDTIFVRLPVNQHAKFKKDFPKARAVKEYVTTEFPKFMDSLSDLERKALGGTRYGEPWTEIDPNKVDDPRIKDIATNSPDISTRRVDNMVRSAYNFGVMDAYEKKRDVSIEDDLVVLVDYPLMNRVSRVLRGSELEDLYIYLNTKYKLLKEKEDAAV